MSESMAHRVADRYHSYYAKDEVIDGAIAEVLKVIDEKGLGLGQKTSRLREILEKVWGDGQDEGLADGGSG